MNGQQRMTVEWTLGSDDDPDQERGVCSLREWLDANEDILGNTQDTLDFAAGRLVRGGGGAAPEWTARLLVDGEEDADAGRARGCTVQERERVQSEGRSS